MSEARIAKLESLLERIQQNRRPLEAAGPTPVAASAPAEPPGARAPRHSPTPMEQALRASAAPEPEVEIVVDEEEDEGPVITIVPPEAEEPEIVVDEQPTAPVGTPAAAPEPSVPQRIEAPAPRPSAPVAKVVSKAAPRTFGELLERTLSLRPR